eukprot:4524099-Prymnesium_polylepis.1
MREGLVATLLVATLLTSEAFQPSLRVGWHGRREVGGTAGAVHPRWTPSRAAVCMQEDRSARIAKLETSIADLAAAGCSEGALAPLKSELQKIKLLDLEDQISALQASLAPPSPATPAPAPPPPPPPPPAPAPDPTPTALSMDDKTIVMRLSELSFEISVAMDEQGSFSKRDEARRLQSLCSERKSLFASLRERDAALFTQTLGLLQASYDIPDSELPAASGASAPPAPSSPAAGDESNVVVIGGK